MEVSQEKLEQELMKLLLQGDHPVLDVLRKQYTVAKIASREFSGVGFFTKFEVSETVPLVEPLNFAAGHVGVQLEKVPNGMGCVLFVRNGKLAFLEGYTYTDLWPEQIIIKSISNVIPAIPE